MPRQADLSFGDFWGVKSCSETDYEKGISVVFINSPKGMQLLENVKDKKYWLEIHISLDRPYKKEIVRSFLNCSIQSRLAKL